MKKELMEMAATADEVEGSDELIELIGVVPSKKRFMGEGGAGHERRDADAEMQAYLDEMSKRRKRGKAQ